MGAQISSPPSAKVKTGTYIGNGVDNRNIDIGVDLAGRSNVWVVIKQPGAIEAIHRTEYGQGDVSFRFDVAIDKANCIQAFTSTGFLLGTDADVNTNGVTYRYIAIWD